MGISIQAEIESFPYQIIKKSARSTALETLLYTATGCTGASLNILPMESGESPSLLRRHLAAIHRVAPFAQKLSQACAHEPLLGIHTGWTIKSQASAQGESWTSASGGQYACYANELFSFGLPEAYAFESAEAYTLTGREAESLTNAQILRILSKCVYLDADAVECLDNLGYGELLGFQAGPSYPVDTLERFSDHPLNEGFANGLRNCRQAFYPGPSRSLIPVCGSEILSALVNYHGYERASCASGIFKNKLGGTVFAGGYYPFTMISDSFKTTQLKRFFATHATLPCYLETYAHMRIWARKHSIVALNASLDEAANFILWVRTPCDALKFAVERGPTSEITASGQNSLGYKRFVLPNLGPWQICLLKEE